MPQAAREAGVQNLRSVGGDLGNEAGSGSSQLGLKAAQDGEVGRVCETRDKDVARRIDGHAVRLVGQASAQIGSPQQTSRGIKLGHKRIGARNDLSIFIGGPADARCIPFRLENAGSRGHRVVRRVTCNYDITRRIHRNRRPISRD